MKKISLIILLITLVGIADSQNVTLNIRALIQGYYRPSLGRMVAVIDSVNHPTICDTLKVNLTDTVYPYTNVLFSSTSVINTDGHGSFTFPHNVLGGTYYIQLVHRSAVTVFSKYCAIISSSPFFYDFTQIPSTISGDNVDTSGSVALMWNGDVASAEGPYTQDGVIESADYSLEEEDVAKHLIGYFPTDLTGDNIVDMDDYILLQNNYGLILFAGAPYGCSATGINVLNHFSETRIFPNPACSLLTISFSDFLSENCRLEIYNSLGERIKEISLATGDKEFVFDVSQLAQGIYLCRLQDERGFFVSKFIKQ